VTGQRQPASATLGTLNFGADTMAQDMSEHASGWIESEIEAYMAARIADRDQRAPTYRKTSRVEGRNLS
jgi:hypothetical protein